MPILYESLFDELNMEYERHILSFLRNHALGGYQDALAEAERIEKETGIAMTVESLKPSHFGWTEYLLPVGVSYMSLKTNVSFYPVGIFSTDTDFEALKWWEGAQTRYLYDWPCFYVALKEEKSAAMFPQPTFKESFTFEVVSGDPGRIRVHAWIIGYIVLPETMREMKVVQ